MAWLKAASHEELTERAMNPRLNGFPFDRDHISQVETKLFQHAMPPKRALKDSVPGVNTRWQVVREALDANSASQNLVASGGGP